MVDFVLSAGELEAGQVLVHSDVWQRADHWEWKVEHGSGWSASGRASTMLGSYEKIDQALNEAIKKAGYGDRVEPSNGPTIIRTHNDA